MKKEFFEKIKDKKYVLTGEQLVELLEDSYKLSVLECNGVDNWSGYTFYIQEDYEREFEENKKRKLDDSLEDWENLSEVSIKDLEHYEELKEN